MTYKVGLESLPMELFLAVVANLGIKDQLALGQCQRVYHDTIERDIFRRLPMRDYAMDHAIKNLNIHLIERLLTQHQSSPTVMFLIGKPYSHPTGFISANPDIYTISRTSEETEFFSGVENDLNEALCGIGELTLHAMAKVETGAMDAGQRKTYFDLWKLFLDHGARLNFSCCPQTIRNWKRFESDRLKALEPETKDDYVPLEGAHVLGFCRRKARKLFRRIMSKPSWDSEQADLKADLIRIYYDQLRSMAVADLHIGPASIFQEIPRHIHSDHDTVVIEALLDGEEKIERDVPMQESERWPREWRSIPLVDRPVQRGQRGELVSPLSAAILNKNWSVFELLIKRGANINGVDLSFKRHCPKKYALHIPIFAAAWVAARDFSSGIEWIAACIENGANPNHLCLGRLNGDFFIESGTYLPDHQGFFHWISPLDVYLSTIPKRILKHTLPETEDSEIVHPAALIQRERIDELATYKLRVDMGLFQPLHPLMAPQKITAQKPTAVAHVCGTSKSHTGEPCNWSGFHRCRSPSAVEIITDRIQFRKMKSNVAFDLARYLTDSYGSGRSCVSRLLFRYESDMCNLDSREFETKFSHPMARFIFDSIFSTGWVGREYGKEMGVYIIYRMLHDRYGTILGHLAAIDRFKSAATAENGIVGTMFHLPRVVGPPPIDFNPLYSPRYLAFDDYRLRTCGRATDRFNANPVEGWTVLHEICRLWNLTTKARSAGMTQDSWEDYRDYTSGIMKLFHYLIENGVNIYAIDANDETPLDVIVKDEENSLSPRFSSALNGMANFMRATWTCFNVGVEPSRERHIDSLRSNHMMFHDSDVDSPTYSYRDMHYSGGVSP